MAITLPLGLRIAAGLLGTTIDRLGTLPKELPTLGISLAGQAVRTSLRIRQELAELATRGDELLSGITGRPEEKPAWATFDEDEPPASSTNPASVRAASVRKPRTTTRPATKPVGTPMPVNGEQLQDIAELKEQLQDMAIPAVRERLLLEESGPNRAAYLTLLTNRLTTLAHENGQTENQ